MQYNESDYKSQKKKFMIKMDDDSSDLRGMGNLTNYSMTFSDMDIDYELNLTINMFSKDKRQIDEPYYTIILICYSLVFLLGGSNN